MVIVSSISVLSLNYYSACPTDVDMKYFTDWINTLNKYGITGYYENAIGTYPPLYVYYLQFVGWVYKLLSLEVSLDIMRMLLIFFITLPTIAANIILAITSYQLFKEKFGIIAFWTVALNPVLILNLMWGQVDVILVLFIVLSVVFICKQKWLLTFLFIALGLLLKLQFVWGLPVLGTLLISALIKRKLPVKKLILYSAMAVTIFLVLFLPFGLQHILTRYLGQINDYNEYTLNAFNIYYLFGLNGKTIEIPIIFDLLNINIVIIISMLTFIMIMERPTMQNAFLYISLLIIAIFVFSTKMHERYIFTSVICFLFYFFEKYDFTAAKTNLKIYILYSSLLLYASVNIAVILLTR